MSISLSTAARNAAGSAIISILDSGSTNPNGYIEIRTGTKPTSPTFTATGTLLATLNLADPSFSSFTNGVATANPISSDVDIDSNGIAGYFRFYNKDNVAVFDGEITATGGGGDLEFDSVNFLKGGSVEIIALTVTIP